MKQSVCKENVILILLGLIFILCVVLVLKKKEHFGYIDDYKSQWPIEMSKETLDQIIAYYLKRPSGMSWEGNARVSPKARSIQEYMYRRDCPIPLISQMHKYDYHLPRNPAVVNDKVKPTSTKPTITSAPINKGINAMGLVTI